MDKFTPKERSSIMSKIRSHDTQFELSFLIKLKRVTAYLRRKGWTVFRLWEHDLKRNSDECIQKISKFLG
jgi:G:T-mismatch repair DNA endonuclease (very short patch repair protein)